MNREVGDPMVADPAIQTSLVHWFSRCWVGHEKTRGMKKVVFELGGNAGVMVDEDADLAFAAQRVRVGAFAYAGQVCISVQRVFVLESVYESSKKN